MPRNITVKFSDGTSHTYENAPDDLTPEAVTARATQDFSGKTVSALDGGRPKATAPKAPAAPKRDALRQDDAKKEWNNASALLESRIKNLPAQFQEQARDRFFKDPRIARLREASARPVAEAKAEGQKASRRQRNDAQRAILYRMLPGVTPFGTMDPDQLAGMEAGFIRNAFGLPERIGAAVKQFTDNPENKSYDDVLNDIRGEVDEDAARSPMGNFLGALLSAGATGSAVGGLARSAGAKIAASGAPKAVQAAGRALEGAATLKSGQMARNAAKIVAAGGAGGAAQAAGEGSDVATGAALGAGGAAALGAGAKGLGFLGKRAADMLGLPNAAQIVRRLTDATSEELAARIAEYEARGISPTLFEILPLKDRNRIGKNLVGKSDEVLEQVQGDIRSRTGNMGREMTSAVERATGPARQNIAEATTRDIADVRGGEQFGDAAVAARATRSPLDMDAVGDLEARSIMQPFDDQEIFPSIDEILPQRPELQEDGSVRMVVDDPSVHDMIRRKAGLLRSKNSEDSGAGITGREMSALLRDLRQTAGRGGTDADIARAAAQHIESVLPADLVDADEAMRATRAARYRMTEGMEEGRATRTRDRVRTGQDGAEQRARNAYDSPEGAQGRMLGQANELADRFGRATPEGVLREAASLPADDAALRANLGPDATGEIQGAAALETDAQRALASLSKSRGNEADELGPEDLANIVLGLSPGSMIRTKVFALDRLTRVARIPEAKAKLIADLMFSQEPGKFQAALNLLNKSSDLTRAAGRDIARAVATGNLAASSLTPGAPAEGSGIIPSAEAAEVVEGPDGMEGVVHDDSELVEEEPDDRPYGRAVVEGLFPDVVHVTDDVRDPNSDLGRKNPGSWHVKSDGAVDVRPIPGMTFEEFVSEIEANGYEVIEAIDEVNHPSGHATGPHWHVVLR